MYINTVKKFGNRQRIQVRYDIDYDRFENPGFYICWKLLEKNRNYIECVNFIELVDNFQIGDTIEFKKDEIFNVFDDIEQFYGCFYEISSRAVKHRYYDWNMKLVFPGTIDSDTITINGNFCSKNLDCYCIGYFRNFKINNVFDIQITNDTINVNTIHKINKIADNRLLRGRDLTVVIDGVSANNADDFLKQIRYKLTFPKSDHVNWEEYVQYMHDLSYVTSHRINFIVTDWDCFLSNEPKDVKKRFLSDYNNDILKFWDNERNINKASQTRKELTVYITDGKD